jgi:hypothetical protein
VGASPSAPSTFASQTSGGPFFGTCPSRIGASLPPMPLRRAVSQASRFGYSSVFVNGVFAFVFVVMVSPRVDELRDSEFGHVAASFSI